MVGVATGAIVLVLLSSLGNLPGIVLLLGGLIPGALVGGGIYLRALFTGKLED